MFLSRVAILVLSALIAVCLCGSAAPSFSIDTTSHQFLLDGQPFNYLAGEIHYFRIPTAKWEDRLKRVRSIGLNAITVPVPWNLHQVDQDSIPDFSGNLDLVKFINLAHENGLYTLIRIGPYIADEWDNGGLPWWLIKNNGIRKYRSSDSAFIAQVSQWWNYLLPNLKPLMRNNGGPILMAQIEHYYGSTGICDQTYILDLANLTKKYLGNDVVLYSVDVPMMPFMQCGIVPGVLPTIEMSPNSDANAVNGWFQQQQSLARGGPRVGSQFLLGPYKLWGTSVKEPYTDDIILKTLQAGWALNASMSFHMTHGGTNFGFWNGNNNPYPVTTSYDSFAPISESGDTTTTLLAIRNFISKIPGWPNPPTLVPAKVTKMIYNNVQMTPVDTITGFITSKNNKCSASASTPMTAEDVGQGYGFVYYQTTISSCSTLTISKFADDAYVFVNGKFMGALYNQMADIHNNTVNLYGCSGSSNKLEIVIEISGRNHLMYPSISKGLQGDVLLNNVPLSNWNNCQTPFGTIGLNTVRNYGQMKMLRGRRAIDRATLDTSQPLVFTGTMNIDETPMNTYLDTTGWGKGFITVNEYNIGRYWPTEGPQQTLYLPSDFLRQGANKIMFYEFEGAGSACGQSVCTVKFSNRLVFSY